MMLLNRLDTQYSRKATVVSLNIKMRNNLISVLLSVDLCLPTASNPGRVVHFY